jgi:hypothetical protein
MKRLFILAVTTGLLALGTVAWSEGGGDDDNPGQLPGVGDATTQKACSECHMAYPAQFLPPESWHVMMTNLRNHFGQDAHFDPATTAKVEAYLVAHATPMRGIDPANPPLRITEMPWFVARHGSFMHSRAPAGGMGNCKACHNGAGGGFGGDD